MAKLSFLETIQHGWKPPAKRRAAAPGGATNGHTAPGRSVEESELLAKREVLAKDLAELQWDLGGITYEMARRDHYRLDVLNQRAAELQKVDSQLGQVERLLKMDETGAAGECPSCGALAAHGAVFCWQCGNELLPEGAAK